MSETAGNSVKSNYITIQIAYTFSTYVVSVNSQYDGRAQLFKLLIPEQVVFISCLSEHVSLRDILMISSFHSKRMF